MQLTSDDHCWNSSFLPISPSLKVDIHIRRGGDDSLVGHSELYGDECVDSDEIVQSISTALFETLFLGLHFTLLSFRIQLCTHGGSAVVNSCGLLVYE